MSGHGKFPRTHRDAGTGPHSHTMLIREAEQCAGFPAGHVCPVIVPGDREYCYSCAAARNLAEKHGHLARVGIILEDFRAPELRCRCGGDPTASRHEDSLLHMEWGWRQATGALHSASEGV